MNKAQRQAAVMDLLSTMYPVALTAQQMADHLAVSVRTLERDLAELQARGLEITSTRGRRGGYIYGEDTNILVVFTRKEAEAVASLYTRSARGVLPVSIALRDAVTKVQQEL